MNILAKLFLSLLFALALPTLAAAQVDLNSADAKTLAESLSGIGLVKAEAIVAYRKTNGPFKTVDELLNVKGIGAKTLDANRGTIVIVDRQDRTQRPERGSRSGQRQRQPASAPVLMAQRRLRRPATRPLAKVAICGALH